LEGWPVDAFTLVDQHGKKFAQERLLGRWTFVLFGDTHCDQPCAAALAALLGLSQRIARTEAVLTTQVVFVSLDPKRDTPPRLREYLAPYDKHFIGATGSPQTLQRLADDMGIGDQIPRDPGPSNTGPRSYPGSLTLVGPDGFVRAEYLPPFDVPLLTAEYLKTRFRK